MKAEMKSWPMKLPEISWEYNGEGIEIFWENPWQKKKEVIATLMWPGHPPEHTDMVEDWYESLADRMCVDMMERMTALDHPIVKAMYKSLKTFPGLNCDTEDVMRWCMNSMKAGKAYEAELEKSVAERKEFSIPISHKSTCQDKFCEGHCAED